MTDLSTRIDQFRKMAADDSTNELAHFSLGRALLEAGELDEAIVELRRTVELKPDLSKAYQTLATALLRRNDTAATIETLTKGINVAQERGDLMPRDEMVEQLKALGVEPPKFAERAIAVGEGEVFCKRCGKVGPLLPKPPFRNDFGQAIFANTCAPCWQEAIRFGTKVINEMRLPLADPAAQKIWDQHVRDFLNLT